MPKGVSFLALSLMKRTTSTSENEKTLPSPIGGKESVSFHVFPAFEKGTGSFLSAPARLVFAEKTILMIMKIAIIV
jgi:hypothetical protein